MFSHSQRKNSFGRKVSYSTPLAKALPRSKSTRNVWDLSAMLVSFNSGPCPKGAPSLKVRTSGSGPKIKTAAPSCQKALERCSRGTARSRTARPIRTRSARPGSSWMTAFSCCTSGANAWSSLFPDLLHAMQELVQQFHPDAILIEDKASGQSAIQELRRSKLPVIALNVDRDKVARARAAAPTAEAGKVWIMREALWARLYIDELCNFPKSEFSDQVDSTTQFINWAKDSLGWSRSQRGSEEKFRREQIARGVPIRYEMGVPVFACARCGKELPLNGPVIFQARGLQFCSMDHAW
ncbi:MAG: hypothetical protein C5B58_05255 [Acidobacteria bacterium]|nr:MAG: hypothetical protein C5B58_05255 [Acidobacteriota bacterium]